MQNASLTVPTRISADTFVGLNDAVRALLWLAPEFDFFIRVEPERVAAAVIDLDGEQHLANGDPSTRAANVLRQATRLAARSISPLRLEPPKTRASVGYLSISFNEARKAFPDHAFTVGKQRDRVWARATSGGDDRTMMLVDLDAGRFALGKAIFAVTSQMQQAPLLSTAPAVREAA